jgi:diacylglycerol O-acyltransferase
MADQARSSAPLSPEDVTMWYADQPRYRTTMALLMLLDRRPDPERLRAAAARAAETIPRLRQVVAEAPFDLALPRWEDDPTFDLDFHVRRYAQAPLRDSEDELGALFRTVGPIYERPFDRSRPLWELIEIDRPEERSAVFFRLHHAMADGVGGNAILAALTDDTPRGEPLPPPVHKPPGGWSEPRLGDRVAQALRRRVGEGLGRARFVAGALWSGARDPSSLSRVGEVAKQVMEDARFESQSPLTDFGRSREISGLELDFAPLRRARRKHGGRTIAFLLAVAAGAMARWHRAHGYHQVRELGTLVPISLRPPQELGPAADLGNRATGILVRLPLGIDDPLRRLRSIRAQVEARAAHPATTMLPALQRLIVAAPQPLFRRFWVQVASGVDLIVTNVPGIPHSRYLAGAEMTGGYPIAPTAPRTPVSIATYGYRGRLFVGLDADGTAMPDLEAFREMFRDAFVELVDAAAR